MKRKKTAVALLLILMCVFLLINTPLIWKWMYPIQYKDEIKQAAERFQVDPMLITAVIRTESGFQTDRVSHKGAIGLMQIMPDTADWIIEQAGFNPMSREYLDEPRVNIDMGTWYLRFLLTMFQEDQVVAIAAYNAGPGKVNKWLKERTWDGTLDSAENIPYGETRHYVQRVLYYKDRYQQIYTDDFG
ncbi:lytic transglycosylase domain-containing protein [Brevibacillus humidisoli]|uniref:lytic transglycosylase domain-containing protein n=1 Tax=Brevibacillus humidisoli TaxID=2895522 RepID=UPI001E5B19CE|nr:lytic transglycosylase domain-containing protein [Brevibacillus humidisoli]UFJ41539.1 lytic transglycosylase domain-containing protein [Brevibacillus humidisoli]